MSRGTPRQAAAGRGGEEDQTKVAETVAQTAVATGPTHDAERLEHLELTIKEGIITFISVGLALAEIRNDKLYRMTHATFEGYCRDRWQFTRQRAYQLIGAAEVAGTLECKPRVDIPEKVLRRLAPFPVEERRKVYDRAAEIAGDRPITISDIDAAKDIAAVKENITTTVNRPMVVEQEQGLAERRLEWENGVMVGGMAALSAISEHPDFRLLARQIITHVAAELWQSKDLRTINHQLSAYVDAVTKGYAPSPTDSFPAPERAEEAAEQLHRGRRVLESDDLGPVVVAKAVSR